MTHPRLPDELPLPAPLAEPGPLALPSALPSPELSRYPRRPPRLIPPPPDRRPPAEPAGPGDAGRGGAARVRRGIDVATGRASGLGCLWWLLLPILAVIVLAATHHDRHHHPASPPASTAHPVVPPGQVRPGGLDGVGLPDTVGGNVPIHPVRLVISLDRARLGPRAEHRELGALGAWLAGHERVESRYRLLRAGRLSAPVTAASLAGARLVARPDGRGLATAWLDGTPPAVTPISIALSGARPLSARTGASTSIALRDGAPAGHTDEADPRRARSIAAAAARVVIAATGARESPATEGR